jgi:hypothetical protein
VIAIVDLIEDSSKHFPAVAVMDDCTGNWFESFRNVEAVYHSMKMNLIQFFHSAKNQERIISRQPTRVKSRLHFAICQAGFPWRPLKVSSAMPDFMVTDWRAGRILRSR